MKSLKNTFRLVFYAGCFLLVIENTAQAQVCNGSWSNSPALNYSCMLGKWIGQLNGNSEPTGCPTSPVYIADQTNTFIFNEPVGSFTIDFQSFTTMTGCARMKIEINGVFYPLTAANLIDIPSGLGCSGSFSFIAVTNDGYITSGNNSTTFTGGRARIIIGGVNADSVSISTNDPAGTIVSSPFNCSNIVPLKLISFNGTSFYPCKAKLNWQTGIEMNVKDIEVQRSVDAVVFKKIAAVPSKGSNSNYYLEADNSSEGYFRLRINDIDGHYNYSEVIKVKADCNKPTYSISPNPAQHYIEIQGLSSNDDVLVLEMSGRRIVS